MLISIIIPAYNIDNYISSCLESVLNQTYKDIEVIVVDDGSTDRTGEICDRYALSDSRLYVIHQKNAGQADARNKAFKHIRGKYLTYVDGDDLIHPEMIDYLVSIREFTDADVVQGSYLKFFDSTYEKNIYPLEKTTLSSISNKIELFPPQGALHEFLYAKKFINGPCGKLIKSELMSDLEFPTNRGYEDGAIMYRLYGKAQKLVYVPVSLYYYRQRKTSTMHTGFNEKKLDRLKTANEMQEYIMRFFPENEIPLNYRYCMAMLQTMMWLPFDKSHREIKNDTYKKLKLHRATVISDKKAPLKMKCMLFASYLGADATMILGRLYRLATNQ